MHHHNKQTIIGNFVFEQDMILLINHLENWRFIRQRKQEQIKNNIIRENFSRINHDYKIGHKVMVRRNHHYKYQTPF